MSLFEGVFTAHDLVLIEQGFVRKTIETEPAYKRCQIPRYTPAQKSAQTRNYYVMRFPPVIPTKVSWRDSVGSGAWIHRPGTS